MASHRPVCSNHIRILAPELSSVTKMLVLVEVSLEPAPESTPCGVVSSVLGPPPAPERTVAQPGQDTAKQGVVVRMCSRARVIHKPGSSSPSSSESRCNSAKGFEVFMVDCTGGASECCDRRGTVCHPSSSSVGSGSNVSCMELDCSAEAFLVIVMHLRKAFHQNLLTTKQPEMSHHHGTWSSQTARAHSLVMIRMGSTFHCG